jgi:hypothetical protein
MFPGTFVSNSTWNDSGALGSAADATDMRRIVIRENIIVIRAGEPPKNSN